MKILKAKIKRSWFDMIVYGKPPKREEYREIKAYWTAKLFFSDGNRVPWDAIQLENGYDIDSPSVTLWYLGVEMKRPRPEWCEPETKNKVVYAILLGDIIYTKNLRTPLR